MVEATAMLAGEGGGGKSIVVDVVVIFGNGRREVPGCVGALAMLARWWRCEEPVVVEAAIVLVGGAKLWSG